jgi:hypothetical protein
LSEWIVPRPPRKDRTTNSKAVHGELRQKLNADRRRRFGDSGRVLALVCECGDPTCRETVLLTPEEFDRTRPGAVVHPAHASAA